MIPIKEFMIDQAVTHARQRVRHEYNRFKFDPVRRENMIVIGTLGQIAFGEFLDSWQLDNRMDFQVGKYDSYDFKVRGKIIEVKTSAYDGSYQHLNLLYTEEQFQVGLWKGFNYVVQVFINGLDRSKRLLDLAHVTSAHIAGYLEFGNIAKFKHEREHYGDDYKVPLEYLLPIDRLVDEFFTVGG